MTDAVAATDWSLGAGLAGRAVLVTGAAGGIGAAVVTALTAVGARVVAVDLDADRVATVLAERRTSAAAVVGADLTVVDDHPALLARAEEEGTLQAVVHCAGVLRRRRDVRDVTEADWDLQHDTNLKAGFFLCRAAAETMRAAGTAGRIVTFASQGWWTGGFGGSVAYAASKGGVVSMSRGLARTYGPYGITVNSVAPGQADTAMLTDDLDPAVLQTMTDQTPLGRIATPAEVAAVAVFLASDHAAFVTGATLNVSGGFLMY